MRIFLWIEIERVEEMYKFLRGELAEFGGKFYPSQPQWAPITHYCQILIDYDDYKLLTDLATE